MVHRRYSEVHFGGRSISSIFVVGICLWTECAETESSVLAVGVFSKAADVRIIDGVQE